MDSSAPAVLDLFSGYGGFSLGLEAAGFRTIAFSEIDPYVSAVLAERFPHVPNLGAVQGVTRDRLLDRCGELPLVVTGGFPCQPHSHAGRRDSVLDPRDLWDECARVLRELRPRVAIWENVRGLLSSDSFAEDGELAGGLFLNRVLSDLADLGYACQWQVVSGADAGAPHLRERVWLICVDELAHRNGERSAHGQPRELPDDRGQDARGDAAAGGADGLADATSARRAGRQDAGSDCGDAREGRGGSEPQRAGGERGELADAAGPGRELVGDGERRDADGHHGARPRLANATGERVQGRGADGEQESPAHAGPGLPLGGGAGGGVHWPATRGLWPAAAGQWPARPGQPQHPWEPPRVVADGTDAGVAGGFGVAGDDAVGGGGGDAARGGRGDAGDEARGGAHGNPLAAPARGEAEPDLGGGADGAAAGLDPAVEPGRDGAPVQEAGEIVEDGLWRTPTAAEAGARLETLSTLGGAPARPGARAYRLQPDGKRVVQSVTIGQQVRMVDGSLMSTDADDLVNRTNRLKATGNGVVPAVAYVMGAAVMRAVFGR